MLSNPLIVFALGALFATFVLPRLITLANGVMGRGV